MKKEWVFIVLMFMVPFAMFAQDHKITRRSSNQKTNVTTTTTTKQSTKAGNSNRTNSRKTKTHSYSIIQNLIDNMVYVEGGVFMMGNTLAKDKDAVVNESPYHRVRLVSFSIGKYEVTQEEWEAVMENNPSEFKGSKLPVTNVSWNDCQEFISKLNKMTGKKFRLPTEAEWEYAARGGVLSLLSKYAGSNIVDDVAWYDKNSGGKTHNVGSKTPNKLGLYDMSGNVWEWVFDRYGDYKNTAPSNPAGPVTGSYRVSRGGSIRFDDKYSRITYRNFDLPEYKKYDLGFRLAL